MRLQYQQRAEPLSTNPETTNLDKWAPVYPAQDRRKPALIAAIIAGAFFFGDIPRAEAVSIDRWTPAYPSRINPAKRAFWQGISVVDPFALTLPEANSIDRWTPTYPNRLDPPKRVFWQGTSVSDPLTPTSSEPTTLDRWAPTYPVRLNPARRAFWQGVFVTDPRSLIAPEAVTLDRWAPTYPNRLDRKASIAPSGHLTIDAKFGTAPTQETITPDKWLPTYPSRLDRARRVFWQGISVTSPTALTQPEATSLDRWSPIYPTQLHKKTKPSPVAHLYAASVLEVLPPPPPPPPIRREIVGAGTGNSQLNISAEITRLKGLPGAPPSKGQGGNAALTGPVSDKQVLGNVLSAIQDSVNGINERLAAIEKWQADIDKRLKAAGI